MAEPSNANPETIFSFKLNPAFKLKQAIESLSDSELNPEGVAMMEVTEKGAEITVRNNETQVAAYLNFKSSGLLDYHFCPSNKPFVRKMINLNQISEFLRDVADDDTITIFHLDGSSNLSFIFGSDPIRELNVELLQMNPEFEKFPDITSFCEAVILCDALREMIDHIQSFGKKLVSVDISERLVSLFIGGKPWLYKYEGEIVGTRGMEPGQKHHAWFEWPHLESLKKASFLEQASLLSFVGRPVKSIMTRFCFRELGDMVFINKATLVIPNSDTIPLGGDAVAATCPRRPFAQ